MATPLALEIILKARDDAKAALDSVKSGLAGVGETASRMASMATQGLGVASGAILALAASATDVEMLQFSFGNLSASIGETSESMIGPLRTATMGAMSDSELMQAANKLMAMGLADSAESAAQMANMATTLGLAMGTEAGPALENFTLMLANQSIPRLDTFGISSGQVRVRMEELQTATEGMTREEAFMIATMELGTVAMAKVGDVSDLTAVKMAGMETKVTNLKDQIGVMLIPILDALLTPLIELADRVIPPLVNWIQSMMDKFIGLPEPVQQVIGVVMGLLASLTGAAGLVSVFSMLNVALAPIGAALGALLAPIALVGAAVAGLALAWKNNWGDIQGKTHQAWADIQAGIQTAIDWIMPYINSFVSTVRGWFEQNWPRIQAVIEQVWGVVRAVSETVINAVAGLVSNVFGGVVRWVEENWPLIEQTVTTVLNAVWTVVETVLAMVQSAWDTHGENIMTIVEGAWTVIKTTITTVMDVIMGIIRTVLLVITGDWEGAWEEIKGIGETLWSGIKTIATTVFEMFKAELTIIWTAVSSAWETVWTTISSFAEGIWDTIKETAATTWTNLKETAAEKWEELKSAIKEKITETLNAALQWLDDTLVAIENFDLKAAAVALWNTVITGLTEKIPEAFAKVTQWLQDTWQSITDKDLKGAATTAFQTAIAGIAEKTSEAMTNVRTWLTNVAKTISDKDMRQDALKAFQTVMAGWITKGAELITDISATLKSIAERIREKDFKSETLTSFQTMIAGALEKAAQIFSEVGTMLTNISTRIQNFSLSDVGAALIEGLKSGILSKAQSVIDSVGGVVNDAINWAKNLLGISSPSTVFLEMGEQMMEGLVAGIDQETASASAAIAKSMADIVQAAADALGAIASIGEAGSLEFTPGVYQALEDQIGRIITIFNRLAQDYGPQWRAAAATFSEELGETFDLFSAAVDALIKLQEMPLSFSDGVFQALEDQIGRVIVIFNRLAQEYGPSWRENAAVFAEEVGDTFGLVQNAVDALVALAELPMEFAPDAFVTLEGYIAKLMDMFIKLAEQYSGSGVDAATSLAEAVGLIGLSIEAVNKALNDWAGTEAAVSGVSNLQAVRDALVRFASDMGTLASNAAQAFYDGIVPPLYDHVRTIANALADGGLAAGTSFMDGLINGLYSRMGDLESLLDYIRGLFPSSPAKHGPFKKLPDWSSLATGLDKALGGINYQLSGFQPAMAYAGATSGGTTRITNTTRTVERVVERGPLMVIEGNLIADDRSLASLERMLERVRLREQARRTGD